LIVVNDVHREGTPCWRNCDQIIEYIFLHLQGFRSHVVYHVKRAANQHAHVLARMALQQSRCCLEGGLPNSYS
jgi:hypothetical protein